MGSAHEQNTNQPDLEKYMDIYNNSIGYQIGKEAAENGMSRESIADTVAQALTDGKLVTLQ